MDVKEIGVVISSLVLLLLSTSCKSIYKLHDKEVQLKVCNEGVPHIFHDLDEGISLKVSSVVANADIYENPRVSKIFPIFKSPYIFVPSISTFADEATRSYMKQIQIKIDPNAGYQLMIEVNKFNITQVDKPTAECRVSLNYRLVNGAGETIIPSRLVSSRITMEKNEDFGVILGKAYASALNEIKWESIAKLLRVADTSREEKNKQVTGAGDTALEHTVIRWFITSAPQGADITWRVISSTSEVANTNSTYVGTTPYETTESFDIKGLTYNNSGNIQIEVTCEKSGYVSQRKRFNLRQAIDQKEISAKFNLIKDE